MWLNGESVTYFQESSDITTAQTTLQATNQSTTLPFEASAYSPLTETFTNNLSTSNVSQTTETFAFETTTIGFIGTNSLAVSLTSQAIYENKTDWCLGILSGLESSLDFQQLHCDTRAFYICEKFEVCWDTFPNVGTHYSKFVGVPGEDDEPFIFNFGQISVSFSNPIDECARRCQGFINKGCVSFSYFDKNLDPDFTRRCYGRNAYSLYGTLTTPIENQYTGILKNCPFVEALSTDVETIRSSRSVTCEMTGSWPAEARKVICPPGCLNTSAKVYGNQYYAAHSSICRAAIHSGQITDKGGEVTIYQRSGTIDLFGIEQHGILSSSITTVLSFVFDPNVTISIDKCAYPPDHFIRFCAPNNTAELLCLNEGCCSSVLNGTRICLYPLSTGTKFTGDRWLKSPHSSYEYALMHNFSPMSMSEGQKLCQSFGGDLAYVGLLERFSYQHIFNNLVNIGYQFGSMWIGIVNEDKDNIFHGLNGVGGSFNWAPGEPNNPDEGCVIISPSNNPMWLDVPCEGVYPVGLGVFEARDALCQRLAGRCDINTQSRVPCVSSSLGKLTKSACIAKSCCYLEGWKGDNQCYHSAPVFKQEINLTDGWWSSPFNEYQYFVIATPSHNYDEARIACQEKGGELAYSGMFNYSNHISIFDNVIEPASDVYSFLWIGITDAMQEGVFMGLDNNTESNFGFQFAIGQPDGNDLENCLAVECITGGWYDFPCTDTYIDASLCQRLPETFQSHAWLNVHSDDVEYAIVEAVSDDWYGARNACLALGGDLAFSDLMEENKFWQIYDNVISLYPEYTALWLGITNLSNDGFFVGLNGESGSWFNFYQPPASDEKCVYVDSVVGNWYGQACNDSVAGVASLCERKKAIEKVTCMRYELRMCETQKYKCHPSATCIDHETWFECICHEGFTGNGEVCVSLYSCPDGWAEESTGCYSLKTAAATFYEAELDCQGMGAHLISIHSEKEYLIFKQLLSPLGSDVSIWIGLKRMNVWTNRDGEELNSSCGLWTDGTKCDFDDITSENNSSQLCFSYNNGAWNPSYCFLSQTLFTPTTKYGYVCKMDLSGPTKLEISLVSVPWSVYPGGVEMKINGALVPWNQVSKLEKGCIHVVSLAEKGTVVATSSICDNDVTSAHDYLAKVSSSFMEEHNETYAVIVTSGNVDNDVWNSFSTLLENKLVYLDFKVADHQVHTYNINGRDLAEGELSSSAALFACFDCKNNCDGAAVFRNNNGQATCSGYNLQLPKWTNFNYAVEVLENSGSNLRKEISFRSKTVKTVTQNVGLSCPWDTAKAKQFGINLGNTVYDPISKSSSSNCLTPPCVLQLGCLRPNSDINVDTGSSKDTKTSFYFCYKVRAKERIFCELYEDSVTLAITRTTMLATFDDLNHLGSPPFEFGAAYGMSNLTWRPMLWKWKDQTYATLIAGVKGRAFRFRNEQVNTVNDVCWWKLGDQNVCPHGITVSFWIRIVNWPTTEDKVVINSGAWGHGGCDGIAIYISAKTKHLVAVFKSDNQTWVQLFDIQLKKWTQIVLAWDPASQTLHSSIDKLKAHSSATVKLETYGDSSDICSQTTFSIGCTWENDVIFDLDELLIYSRYLSWLEQNREMPVENFPIRHRLLEDSEALTAGKNFIGSLPCRSETFPNTCGDFGLTCLGTSMLCRKGFNLAFQAKVQSDVTISFSNTKDHIMLVTNIPDEDYNSSPDSISRSFGFRVLLKKGSSDKWQILLQNTMTEDPVTQQEISWEIQEDSLLPFWIQFSPDGIWIFCYRWPTNCKKTTSMSQFDVYSSYHSQEQLTEFSIGPVLLRYNLQDAIPVHSTSNIASIRNVWMAEQAFDIAMFADEVNMLDPPLHWQVDQIQHMTNNQVKFDIMGDADKVTVTEDAPFGLSLSLNNGSNDSLETNIHLSWLEMTPDKVQKNMPCLYDVNNCLNGFTLQFWYKFSQCNAEESVYCYIVSTGGQATPVSNGLAFYYEPNFDVYHVILATSEKVWKISVELNLSEAYGLIRISWEKNQGLSFFLNDIPIVRQTEWQAVKQPSVDGIQLTDDLNYLKKDSYLSMTFGKRNDLDEGFSQFSVADLHYWDGIVEGMPFQSISRKCLAESFQVGETCYKLVNEETSYNNAEKSCAAMKGDLAYIPSLPVYQALEIYLKTFGAVSVRLWLSVKERRDSEELVWDPIQRTFSSLNFDAVLEHNIHLTNIQHWTMTNQLPNEFANGFKWHWDNVNSTDTASYMCAIPMTKDPHLRGCYKANNFFSGGFSWSDVIPLYNLAGASPTKSMNNLGSYDITHGCRRLCLSQYASHSSVILLGKCRCFNNSMMVSDIMNASPAENTVNSCYGSYFQGISAGNLAFGYSTLNFPSLSGYDFSIKQGYCGPVENGGVFKCGVYRDQEYRGAVYALDAAFPSDKSIAPVTSVTVEVIHGEYIEVYQPVLIHMLSAKCCRDEIERCECIDSYFVINIDLGNSESYEVTLPYSEFKNFSITHFYKDPGKYKLKLQVSNSFFSPVQYSTTLKVSDPIEKPEINFIKLDVVQPGQLAEVITIALSGSYMTCIWNYGDGSPLERIYLVLLPIPKTYHRFQEPGVYTVIVTCVNRLQFKQISTEAIVHLGIQGLQVSSDVIIKLGTTYRHEWQIVRGSHIDCNVYFGNFSLPEALEPPGENDTANSTFYFDSETNQGFAYISPELYLSYQSNVAQCFSSAEAITYVLVVTCYNAVTDPSPSVTTYLSLEIPVIGLSLTLLKNEPYVKTNELICLESKIENGTNIVLRWDWGHFGKEQILEYCSPEECNYRKACMAYDEPGVYTVQVDAMNAIGMLREEVILFVETPVLEIHLEAVPALIPFYFSELHIKHKQPHPTGYFEFDFGDGNKMESLLMDFDDQTNEMIVYHRYESLGIYNIQIKGYNNVSSYDTSLEIQIGLSIKDVSINLKSSRFARCLLDSVVYEVIVEKGSALRYDFDFGDGSKPVYSFWGENATRLGPNYADIHFVQHIYDIPGNYTASVEVSNIFGKELAFASSLVTLQNPLHSSKYSLIVNKIDTINFPSGIGIFNAHLEKNESFVFVANENFPSIGWANNVYVTWIHTLSSGSVILSQDYGHREIDLFPKQFMFTRDHVGANNVIAELSNRVSSVSLTYEFVVIEVLEGLRLDVINLEDSSTTYLTNVNDGVFTQTYKGFSIVFRAFVSEGSHATFTIDYGDSSVESKHSPVLFANRIYAEFSHSYKHEGNYALSLTASNGVSSLTRNFSALIQVYEKVSNITTTTQFVDFDERLTEINVMKESSELYALAYGKSGIVRNENSFSFPLSHPLTFHAGSAHGSNLSITWHFIEVNVLLQFQWHEGMHLLSIADLTTGINYTETNGLLKVSDLEMKRLAKLTPLQLHFLGPWIAAKLDKTEYRAESYFMVRFRKVGLHTVKVTFANPISSKSVTQQVFTQAAIQDVTFEEFEPPVANRTFNLTLKIGQIGTNSCIVINPGDLSSIFSFGANAEICLKKRTISNDNFYTIVEDRSTFLGKNFSRYAYSGDLLGGTASINLTIQHVYTQIELYRVSVYAFNDISQVQSSIEFAVTEILCDYPIVVLEKPNDNSVTVPRRIFSFLEFRLFSSFQIKCKLTSRTVITWYAYEMVDTLASSPLDSVGISSNDNDMYVDLPQSARKFSSERYKFKPVSGLQFTSNSEDIAIPVQFFKLGLHLVCVNVAMFKVEGIHSSDCIYLNIVLSPLVAGISYGVRRAVGYKKVIEMDAASASYDPNRQKWSDIQNPSYNANAVGLTFTWSCPFLIEKSLSIISDDDSVALMFGGVSGWQNNSFCGNISLKCSNSFHVIEVQSARYLNFSALISEANTTNIVKAACMGRQSCVIERSVWTTSHVNLEYSANSTVFFCIEIIYQCKVPDNAPFGFISPNKSCVASGYYPVILNNTSTSAVCEAITSNKNYCGKIMVNTSAFEPGSNYMTLVMVADPPTGRISVGYQVIQVNLGEPPKLKVVCRANCGIKVNARTSISAEVQHINEFGEMVLHNNTSLISYTWSLFEVVNKTRYRRNAAADEGIDLIPVTDFENYAATGIHGIYLVIKPGTLLPLRKYRIQVAGTISGTTTGLTETEVIPNLPPYDGSCDITPNDGIAADDTFTVTCVNWKDEGINVNRNIFVPPEDYSLLYYVYYGLEEALQPNLLSYGGNATISGLFFPPGLDQNDFRVWIQVRVVDEYGAQALVNMSVTVYEATKTAGLLEEVTVSQISQSSAQNIAQFSSAVSGVLNKQVNTTSENGSTSAQDRNSDHEISKANILLRTNLIDAVVDRINTDSDLDGIQQSCSAIGSLTAVPSEVEGNTQLTATDALSERSNLLFRLSESKPAEDVRDTAEVMVAGLENVVKSARSQVIRDADAVDSHSSLVSLPIFSLKPQPEHSSRVVLDEEEEFLSPEERLERRNVLADQKSSSHEKNRMQAMKVGVTALSSMNMVADALLKQKLPGEPVVEVQANGLKMEAQRSNPADLCRVLSQNETTNSTPSALTSILLSSNVQYGNCDDIENEEAIDTELMILDDNPYIWDGSADEVRSSVVSFSFKSVNGSKPFQKTNNTFRIELPVQESLSTVPAEQFEFTPSGENKMSYHELIAEKEEDVTFLTVKPAANVIMNHTTIRIYFRFAPSLQVYPTIDNYTFVHDLPQASMTLINAYRLRLNHKELPYHGRYVFGILQIDAGGNITSGETFTLHNYTIQNMVTSCRFWNETTVRWETTGCRVSDETSNELVVCLCNHLTSFGANFVVAPNPIDFASIGNKLQNLKDNLAVLMTIIALFVLYVVGIIYCRRQDKKDVSKWSVALLMDNNLCAEQFYQITVKTGARNEANTSSKIYFILAGEEGDTSLRMLADTQNTTFLRGSVRKFLLAVDKPLGVLVYLRIWHDNSGKGDEASWFLEHIIVNDLQENKKYYFFCDDWLAVDQSDGNIERILPVASDTQIGSFRHLFSSSTKRDFSDGHLWFSIFSRPTKSNFTRVQRLSCGLAVLFSTMLASCMFYGVEGDNVGQQGVLEIGPIKFTIQQLLISIEASLIVVPVNVLLVQLFRRIRPKEDTVDAHENVREVLNKSTVSLEPDANQDEENKSKRITFPHWVVYVNWVLVAVVVLATSTFVFLYSVDWGAQRSNDWLLSIVMSLTQSIFVIQPAKVILGAIFFSFVINRCAKEKAAEIVGEDEEVEETEEDKEEFKRKEEEWLLQCPMDDEIDQMRQKTEVLNKECLEEARRKRHEHKVMVKTIHDVCIYLVYLILMLTAVNSSKDPQSFRFHRSLSDIFLAEGEPILDQVRTSDDFWAWCNSSLVPGLHASVWYNGKRITWMQSRYVSNRETFVTGPARIRQLRVEEGPCEAPANFSLIKRECKSSYAIWNQETRDFTSGWKLATGYTNSSDDPWKFQNLLELGGYPYNGLLNWYDGGGYAVTLGNTAKSSRIKLDQLKNENWIDRYTAAIFVEFTVYNANINLFASAMLLLERSPNGAFFAYPAFCPIRLYEFIDGKGYFVITVYVLLVIALAYNIYQMFKSIKIEKKNFFRNFWNVLDVSVALLTLIAIAFYALRLIHANITLNKLTEDVNKEKFVNFQYVTLWNQTFVYLMAFTLFLSTIKFSKLLRFNRRIRLLARTLEHAAKPVLFFTIMFGIYFIAFHFLAHLWFEQKMYPYSSHILTAEQLFSMLLGRFDFTELQTADQLLGPFFFTAFTGVLTIALLNMFIVILDESIKKARAEMESATNEFEVVEYMMKQLSNCYYNYAPKFMLEITSQEEQESDTAHSPVYIDCPEEVLELRIDALMDRVKMIEQEFYSEVTLEELEAELVDETEDQDFKLSCRSIQQAV
ncbi:uncharacterized protein LOC143464499 isoform X1 [Clavelina lepadiformis]|uniref:uncharacterized protein LOC143464499 isoform X1 n=2 Tax=Clavelina lepadiformis TaxID=159417 RepID=UPI0040427780